jgi:hypothetical protein
MFPPLLGLQISAVDPVTFVHDPYSLRRVNVTEDTANGTVTREVDLLELRKDLNQSRVRGRRPLKDRVFSSFYPFHPPFSSSVTREVDLLELRKDLNQSRVCPLSAVLYTS